MTVWHWVRHAPTHASNFVGWRDVPADLSDAAALQRLRAHLPQEALLVSSDLERARQTATAISCQGHDRLPDDPHLRETGFIERTQHSSEGAVFQMREPSRFSDWEHGPLQDAPTLGEHTSKLKGD